LGDNLISATASGTPSSGLQKLIDGSSGRVVYVKFDAAGIANVKKAAGEVEHYLKAKGVVRVLDVLINNAGVRIYIYHNQSRSD
jgi:NAD(P)-dependent dehydrogenase (short-subunit alcohol dehydrogenase family)